MKSTPGGCILPLFARGMASRALHALVLLALASTALAHPAPATAQDLAPRATYSGYVIGQQEGALPTRVRAVAEDGTVCGTAKVEALHDLVGWYEIGVASGEQKAGCPLPGDPVYFRLLYGMLDEYLTASETPPYGHGEHTLHLFASQGGASLGFAGTPPPPGGVAIMRWEGPGGAPTELAAATIPVEVAAVYRLNQEDQRWQSWIAGAPAWTQTYTTVANGDIVIVRAR